jgi:hypothetical protein
MFCLILCSSKRRSPFPCIAGMGLSEKYPNRAIHYESTPYKGKPKTKQKEIFDFADQYAYTKEELDQNFLKPLGPELGQHLL